MKELTRPANIEHIPAVTEWMDQNLEEAGCPMKVAMQISIAIDEIYSNISYYAYDKEGGNVTVRLEILETPSRAKISFIDQGKPYNPLKKEDPDVTLSAEDREIGGLGIFMVKKTMDAMEYEYKNQQNILTLTKNF